MRKDLHEENRKSWNAATVAHNSHKGDQAAFLRAGGSTLFPEEVELLGDVAGRDLLHMQCNSGQDTLSIARLGARVTGVDISDEAIAFAEALSRGSGIAGIFLRADLLDYFDTARAGGTAFDVAFCSYGAVCWISDLAVWAKGIHDVLKPGGRFVSIDFHPALMIFDEQWRPTYGYFNDQPQCWQDGISDYVAASSEGLALGSYEAGIEQFRNPHPSFEFIHPLASIVTALIGAGLRLDRLVEYPYSNGWKGFEGMTDSGGRRMVPPSTLPSLPMMYAIVATRP